MEAISPSERLLTTYKNTRHHNPDMKPSSLGTLCAHLEVREGDDSKMHLTEVGVWTQLVQNRAK
jgi:hypothetical protein